MVTPLLFQLDIEVEKNNQSVFTMGKKIIGMIEVDVFILAEVFIGICWGFHINFLPVYMSTELGASKTVLGLNNNS